MTARLPRGVTTRAAWRSARAVLPRPDLWWTTLAALYRLAPPAWWRRWPHLPVPDGRLWDFRMVTVYGTVDADPSPLDVISYLEWCHRTRPPLRIGCRSGPPSDNRLGRSQSG
jgi:hypothetical protein